MPVRPEGLLRILKEEGERGVYLVDDPRWGEVVVKRWPRTVEERCKALLGLTQAQRQVAGALRLRTAGVATPEVLQPLRVAPENPRRLEIRLRWIEGTSLLDRLRVADDGELRRLGSAMRELLERLGRAGLFHRDAKPSNFVVAPTGALVAIDPVGVRRRRPANRADRYRRSLACEFTAEEARRCAEYLSMATEAGAPRPEAPPRVS